jgi:hypothetical protein
MPKPTPICRGEELARSDPAQNAGPDQDPATISPRNAGLVETLEPLRHEFGGDEDHEHRERDFGGLRL